MGDRDYEKMAEQYRKEFLSQPTPPRNLGASIGAAMQSKDALKKPMTEEQAARLDEHIRSLEEKAPTTKTEMGRKKGGKVCGMKKGGKVRGCGIAERGLTKGKMR